MPEAVLTAAGRAASPYLPEPYRIVRRRRETADTWTLELEPEAGGEVFAFAPGQFTMVYAFGAGEVPVSISGDPGRRDRLIHTIRVAGPTTRTICSLTRGATLGVRGPYGTAWPVERALGGDLVIAAGGIGLAPLRPALYAALARREELERIVLLYGGRSPDQLLYAAELERWGAAGVEVHVTVDKADEGWNGPVGVVTTLIERASFDASRATALVCGPEVMMRFTAAGLVGAGIAAEGVFLSMERNMKCALGQCGRCQFGPVFVCGDGPVFSYASIERLLTVREL
ncbi:MAG TPA: FAD/NAD(P)-binding protein [Gaiellaceae bacterium]|nr:FAD/NAD(P)-binding protein [Gaiellaceae bacterium]